MFFVLLRRLTGKHVKADQYVHANQNEPRLVTQNATSRNDVSKLLSIEKALREM